MKVGTLRLRVEQLQILKDKSYNPYLQLSCAGVIHATRVIQQVRLSTLYNTDFTWEISEELAESHVKIALLSKNSVFADELLGEADLNLDYFFGLKGKSQTLQIQLFKGEKPKAKLNIRVQFENSFLAVMMVSLKDGLLQYEKGVVVVIELGQQKKRSSKKNMAWKQSFRFNLVNLFDSLILTATDGQQTQLAKGVCEFVPLQPPTQYKVKMVRGGAEVGCINIAISFSK